MAEVPDYSGGTMFKTTVTKDGVAYQISTANTFDRGWETLLFGPNGAEGSEYDSWHPDYESAKRYHEEVVSKFRG